MFTLQEVMEKYPKLTANGLEHFGHRGCVDKVTTLQQRRDQLAGTDPQTIAATCAWILKNPTVCANTFSTSYGAKHRMQSDIGLYTSSGQFSACCLMVGLIPRREDFNMSFKLSDEIAAMKRRISIDFTLQKSLIANRLRELKNPFAAKKTNKEVIQTINSMRELLDKMEKTLGMESYK